VNTQVATSYKGTVPGTEVRQVFSLVSLYRTLDLDFVVAYLHYDISREKKGAWKNFFPFFPFAEQCRTSNKCDVLRVHHSISLFFNKPIICQCSYCEKSKCEMQVIIVYPVIRLHMSYFCRNFVNIFRVTLKCRFLFNNLFFIVYLFLFSFSFCCLLMSGWPRIFLLRV
jgi:hypothetical protein